MAIISNGKTLTMPLKQYNFVVGERDYYKKLYVMALKRIVGLEDRIKELEAPEYQYKYLVDGERGALTWDELKAKYDVTHFPVAWRLIGEKCDSQ